MAKESVDLANRRKLGLLDTIVQTLGQRELPSNRGERQKIYLYVMASTSWTDVLSTGVAVLVLDRPGVEQMSHFVVNLLVASRTERRASSSCLISARHPYSHPVDRTLAEGGFRASLLSTFSVLIPLITAVQYNVTLVKEAYAHDQLG